MKKYDVIGLGNAIVDVLAKVDDKFLANSGLTKGSMTLINESQAEKIYKLMPQSVEKSGGSAANTMAGIASLGGKAAFIGKVKNDQLGKIFTHDIRAIGVDYETSAAEAGSSTARCLISVTPDAQRTMATFLGATRNITEEDISERLIASGKILYLEGYLWDEERAKNAMRLAISYAKKQGTKIALSLSDSFCVNRHRTEFLELIHNDVDILFANIDEIRCLFEINDEEEIDENLASRFTNIEIAAITKGAKGSIIFSKSGIENIAAGKNLNVVDTTGAGDLYAAGFLFGYTQGHSMKKCGEIACIAASEVIQHMGARPEVKLANLVA